MFQNKAILCGLAALCLISADFPAAAQSGTGAKNGEWRTYGADLANSKYSPLNQIDATNFDKLQLAWRFHTENFGPRQETTMFESTPLMANGVVFSTAGTRRDVVALDAITGEIKWVHVGENEGQRGANASRSGSGRGLAYWTDGREERILYVTPGYRLVALDAKTGALVQGFGTNGVVDLKMEDDQQIDLNTGDVGLTATPTVAGNTIIIGAAHKNGWVPPSKENVKGYVRGYDAKTGKRLWIFHTIPRPNELGYNTWEKDSAEYTGNDGVWGQISVDEELGMVYLPVELPTGDYYGGDRPGNNLFGESVVAVDLKTGQRKWHYQLVHHGMWDMDIPCAPMLVDLTINGATVKALAQPTKQSFLYVFNRVTGEPIWPIVERPVPKGDVPGEWYSPTQPFPTKPPQYGRYGSSIDDLINFTPELRAEALKFVEKYKIGPIFTPPVVSKIDGPLGTLIMGAPTGGTNWPGGSYDPQTHIVYVYSQSAISSIGLVPSDGVRSTVAYVLGSAATPAGRGGGGGRGPAAAPGGAGPGRGAPAPGGGGRGGLNIQGLPLIRPPYGTISAISLDKGEILWQINHGETPDEIRNHPLLKGLNIPRTGQAGIVGVLTTSSLVIAGESMFTTNEKGEKGARLRAYDKATGKDAGEVWMSAPQTGSPMTYMAGGKQHIVIATGGPGAPGELQAFTLPQ